ncbi:unnamed protein product [Linum tenue]|uniref:Condensin complex subunit 2 n=1 Tax=Linum tenue TaxID=586396 RepID=A0AAV0H2B3_9ROSI|nr:unnamed protein product [Linum tenue]
MRPLNPSPSPPPSSSSLASDETRLLNDEIFEQLHSCIKLANENKINHKNAWGLKLIDHLMEIVKAEADGGAETNFRTASCSLEAGVKIYSVRVDALYSEAYNVLGGISVASLGSQEDIATSESHNAGSEEGKDNVEEKLEKKLSPLSTIESSIEALNWNGVDSAAVMDPSYYRTSLTMSQGGSESLLLNNVGVYGECRLLFDYFEVPGRNMSCMPQSDMSDVIDISFAKDSIEQMVINLPRKMEISPTLREIVSLLNESRQMPFERSNLTDKFCNMDDDIVHDEEVQSDNHSFENSETTFQENDYYDASFESDVSTSYERVAMFLFRSLDITGKQNSWAGPDYWKFLKPKGGYDYRNVAFMWFLIIYRQYVGPNILFEQFKNLYKLQTMDLHALPAGEGREVLTVMILTSPSPWTLRLISLLPQQIHCLYFCQQIEYSRAILFQKTAIISLWIWRSFFFVLTFCFPFSFSLLQNLQFLGRRSATLSDSTSEFHDPDEASPSSDCVNPCDLSGQHGDNYFHEAIGAEEPFYQNGQVNKMEGRHGKASKPVDLRALKQTLWEHLQEQSGSFPATTSVMKHPSTLLWYCHFISFDHLLPYIHRLVFAL